MHFQRNANLFLGGAELSRRNGSVAAAFNSVRALRSTVFLMAFSVSAATPVLAQSGGETGAGACWNKEQLRARGGKEKQIQRRVFGFDAAEAIGDLPTAEPVRGPLRGAIRRVTLPPGEKLVALTIDFCESPGEVAGYDGDIIDYLRAERIPATLFVGGKWLRSHPERSEQLIADRLFEIGNHGDGHRDARHLAGRRLKDELLSPQASYRAVRTRLSQRQCFRQDSSQLGGPPERMRYYRFPFGRCDRASLKAVNDAGMLAVQWDISTGDAWRGQTAQRIAQTVLQRVKPGSILLAHGNGRGWHTAAGLKELIPPLKQQGFQFVTVGELLQAGEPVIEERCYDARPGDTDRAFRRAPRKRPNQPSRSGPIQKL